MLDTHQSPARFVQLTTVGDLATARVLAARLNSEGIEVRLHGFALGPYPMTVGALAETELWVLNDRVEEASQILLDTEVNDALHGVEPEVEDPWDEQRSVWRYPRGPGWKVAAWGLTVAFVGVWLMRLFRILGLY